MDDFTIDQRFELIRLNMLMRFKEKDRLLKLERDEKLKQYERDEYIKLGFIEGMQHSILALVTSRFPTLVLQAMAYTGMLEKTEELRLLLTRIAEAKTEEEVHKHLLKVHYDLEHLSPYT